MSFRRILTVVLAVLLLVGCSGGGNSGETPEPERKVLRVGMECNYAPFNWTTTTPGEHTVAISSVDYADGFDVVITSMLAEQMGMEVQIVKLDWDNLIPSLQHDQIDAVIAGMTDTPVRREVVDFTTPYYVSEEVVIVRKDGPVANISSISELAGFKVQGQMNTIYDDIIDQIEGVQHMPAAETFPASIQAVLAGGVDAVTSELPVAVGVVAANPELAYIQFSAGSGFAGSEVDASVSIAVKKGNTELLNALQQALNTISEADRQQLMLDATNRQPAGE
ncbi:MAG: transporter substrate-binding domain-containing protein [Erysipelotrichaceae bacterium]|nr:transporter substrate-binding domain-containing protein [Erysipelotrichaceae bacterium]